MARYFIEVAYKGTSYAGFQVQQNANTIQGEMEKALHVYFRSAFQLTGSSRTDAGVHALQNFFHFDHNFQEEPQWQKVIYHLNAILPADIVVKKVTPKSIDAHCRFDAKYRSYEYTIYTSKDPFLQDRAYFYPYKLDLGIMNEAASLLPGVKSFESFAKRNIQVKTFDCSIYQSEWLTRAQTIVYRVSGNRFLRGMVRGLAGTMLKVGRGTTSVEQFQEIIRLKDPSLVDFSVPPQGLTLVEVAY